MLIVFSHQVYITSLAKCVQINFFSELNSIISKYVLLIFTDSVNSFKPFNVLFNHKQKLERERNNHFYIISIFKLNIRIH